MTEQQLARSLVHAGLLDATQVQAAVAIRSAEKNFAQVVVDKGWVEPTEILKIDPGAFQRHHEVRRPPAGPERVADKPGMSGTSPASAERTNGAAPRGGATALDIGLGHESAPDMDETGVVLEDENIERENPMMGTTVRLCHEILQHAVAIGASDVHLEPRTKGLLPRYRVDGLLRSGKMIPRDVQGAIVSRMKVMANLNISETRLSQDGRFRATVGGHLFDFRVSTLPGIHGEKVVLRLLDHSSLVTDLTRLGFTQDSRATLTEMLNRNHGMILVTGPTGSGKSTTLYASLAATLDETKNVVTVEDPVEYELEGVMQTAVHAEIGNTFANRLRSILRQDPDVILIGEIRDSEAADIAIRAALTGHLVLSTLHTNSAVTAVTRLQDMGVAPFLIASSLSGVVAQRLVRLICRSCREPVPIGTTEYELSLTQLRLPPRTRLYRGAGCSECNGTGLRGRVALVEVLTIDKDIRRAIADRADADTLHYIAVRNGMRTLYKDGIEKLIAGLTTADELARILLGIEEVELV